jgi:ATP-dependent DNA helicase RecG
LGVQVAWLAGRQKSAQRRAELESVADGAAALVVGTHALIQDAVRFARLGLAIVDEQHRFGVVQRLALRRLAAVDAPQDTGPAGNIQAGEGNPADAWSGVPHLLMLSATPIPRTLAMSYLADLDVSVIDQLPPGRKPVVTKLVSERRRDALIGAVADQVANGRQVYWVCPLVDDEASEALRVEAQDQAEARAATDLQARSSPAAQSRLQAHRPAGAGAGTGRSSPPPDAPPEPNGAGPHGADGPPLAATLVIDELREALPRLRVGLLHGQLPQAEKAAVMAAFAAGGLDVLVATTVVEVGLDVANATLMVVDHAQRFGLAQLHQLRGRVGRGRDRSYCVLLYDEPLSAAARERLMILHGTNDGFEIARRDLALRGPGEFLGARQSGQPLLRYADLTQDAVLVEHARDASTALLRDNPAGAQAHARRWLAGREGFLGA